MRTLNKKAEVLIAVFLLLTLASLAYAGLRYTTLTAVSSQSFYAYGENGAEHSGVAIIKFDDLINAASVTNAGTAVATSVTLPTNAIVQDVWYVVTSNHSGATFDLGISGGDEDGFIDGASLTTAGFGRPGATVTAGGTETYYSANTRGALISNYVAGSNSAADHGLYSEKWDTTSSADTLCYTCNSTGLTAKADVYFKVLIVSPSTAVDVTQ